MDTAQRLQSINGLLTSKVTRKTKDGIGGGGGNCSSISSNSCIHYHQQVTVEPSSSFDAHPSRTEGKSDLKICKIHDDGDDDVDATPLGEGGVSFGGGDNDDDRHECDSDDDHHTRISAVTTNGSDEKNEKIIKNDNESDINLVMPTVKELIDEKERYQAECEALKRTVHTLKTKNIKRELKSMKTLKQMRRQIDVLEAERRRWYETQRRLEDQIRALSSARA